MKKKKKMKLEQAISFTQHKLDNLVEEYKEHAANFSWMVSQGTSLNNIHAQDTLRKLTFLYTDIAAHHDALKSMKTEF